MERIGLAELRKNMKEFIRADYRDITLERPTKIATTNGSWIEGNLQPIAPQRFRLIPAKRRTANPEVDNQEGNIPYQDWTMIGYWNADIQADDEFTLYGDRFKVTAITPDTREREFTDRVTAQLELRSKGAG
jgi:hypothetical protein